MAESFSEVPFFGRLPAILLPKKARYCQCPTLLRNMAAAWVPSSLQQQTPQELCKRCGGGGSDVRIVDCGCTLHARCTPLVQGSIPIKKCPCCNEPVAQGIFLIPMSFEELDEAKRVAATANVVGKRGMKRKNATIARLNPTASTTIAEESDDLRTGRWTNEEMAYCDKLVEKFQAGQLPLLDGTKLNDFLAGMLKSKQSRLTKKMKNAKLSAKTFTKSTGYLPDDGEAIAFTKVEDDFFASIPCSMERAEIRFHMQKEWREFFSSYCIEIGQPLDADKWMSSVDELDRRVSQAKDAARMARRKKMMGYALSQDSRNPDQGVFIEQSSDFSICDAEDFFYLFGSDESKTCKQASAANARRMQNAPFLGKMISYMQRHAIPFEHVDAWVPSFVPVQGSSETKCRLCFAGSATTENQIGTNGQPFTMSNDDRFDWLAFGEYSQKFSFDVGCGLPGRVYQHGVPSWEQNVENAPPHHFERCGGASQWGIKTVVAIPIPSPSVGRLVILMYSRSDRPQDQEMVCKMASELSKLVPSPKWKLVVDVGTPNLKRRALSTVGSGQDPRAADILSLIGEYTPSSSTSPHASYLPGFTSLRLILMKTDRTPREAEVLATLLESYSSYVATGKQPSEIAWLLARDCMHLCQQAAAQPQGASLPQEVLQVPQIAALPSNSLAVIPRAQENSIANAFNPAQVAVGVTSSQGIRGLALPSAQALYPGHHSSSESQGFQGIPPASQYQNGRHFPNDGT